MLYYRSLKIGVSHGIKRKTHWGWFSLNLRGSFKKHLKVFTSFRQDAVPFGHSNINQDGDYIWDFHMEVGSPKVLILTCSYACRGEHRDNKNHIYRKNMSGKEKEQKMSRFTSSYSDDLHSVPLPSLQQTKDRQCFCFQWMFVMLAKQSTSSGQILTKLSERNKWTEL